MRGGHKIALPLIVLAVVVWMATVGALHYS
jgi:hypothetical protein